ncbi:APC family permease [Rhodospirillaceae bacterium SYSU D60014]|uniref:APC family permease n=1 Tax=Virgifigura deserti TaxID=2268457 RepID=UPI000E6740F3
MTTTIDSAAGPSASAGLHRTIGWKHAFWVASGVPALVLFSIGGIAATIGSPSWMIWVISVSFGFIQAFTYAEIAGLFPSKSGGASVYGAAAWVRYSRIIAPLSVWCNWLAWTPVLAIGAGLGAGYILTALFAPDAAINTWQITLADLGFLKEGLTIRINSTFVLGTVLLLAVFAAQHHGILRTAKIQTIIGLAVIIPLLIVGIVPILTGEVVSEHFTPFVPIAFDGAGNVIPGEWDRAGWTLFLGGLFIAAWSAYAFETAICYTSEFKNPATDTYKAILYAGLLCVVVYTVVPFSFQGALGVDGMLEPGIVDGSGVAAAMASMVGGGPFIQNLLVIMLILALLLAIMTSMAGSSRTLYQGSVDGWLPRYLSHSNQHGAPTRAMWTDLSFNLILLMMSDYLFVLAVSNCCYLVFNFLNLNAGWIHRIDNGDVKRPWKAPNWLMGIGVVLSFVNAALLGAGANVWGPGTLMSGIIAIALIIPVFLFRHYVQDKGEFPPEMLDDLRVDGKRVLGDGRKAGILPYVTLVAGATVVFVANWFFYL